MSNKSQNAAKKAKYDEFYTLLPDIDKELSEYKPHFKDKVVYCNCDDPRDSNFFKYFVENFEHLGLKKLIATCYQNKSHIQFSEHIDKHAVYQIYEGDKNGNLKLDEDEVDIKQLKGDGDFRSDECLQLLKESDIVCTNPPFSLFGEYIDQLIKHNKQFLIIGNQNAIGYTEIFPLIKNNIIWGGA